MYVCFMQLNIENRTRENITNLCKSLKFSHILSIGHLLKLQATSYNQKNECKRKKQVKTFNMLTVVHFVAFFFLSG